MCHHETCVGVVNVKTDLLPFFDPFQHLRIVNLEHHGHSWHTVFIDRTVGDNDLALFRTNRFDKAMRV